MPRGPGGTMPLVGRDVELGLLREALDRSLGGTRQIVVVEGEAGIGKSRLLDEAVSYAVDKGFEVFCGSADELERDRPFAAVADALAGEGAAGDPTRARLLRLVRPSGGDEPAPVEPGIEHLRFRFVEELVAFLEREAHYRPVLVGLEDLQWADPSTLLTAGALARRLRDVPLALVLTLRPTPRPTGLPSLVDALVRAGAAVVTVGPLPEQGVHVLVEAALGAVPSSKLLAQARRGGGNPLWVLEILTALCQAEAIEVSDGIAELRKTELPASLRSTILRRLGFLPETTLHMLRLAAVLGASFDPADLAVCVGRPVAEVLPVIDEAVRAGIVGEAGDRLAFRHDVVREVVYEDIPLAVRRGLHLDAGRALARAGRRAADVATHLAIGASPGDAETVAWLQRAAREAAPRAPGIAAALFERALELVGPEAPQRQELAAERVAALVRAGRPVEAEALARERLVWAPQSQVAGQLRWGLAAALQVQGRLPEALEETLAAAREPGLDAGRRARLLAEASQWSFYTGAPKRARTLAEEAITAGEAHGDDVAVCLGLTALSRLALDELRFPRAIELARRAFQRACERGLHTSTVDWIHPAFDLGGALVTADHLDAAEETLRAGRRMRQELGSTWDVPLFTSGLAHVQLYTGRWDDAVAEAATALEMAADGAAKGSLLWTYTLLAWVAVHRGDLEAAERVLDQADAFSPPSRHAMGSDAVAWCRGLLHEAEGDVERAAALMAEAWGTQLPFKAVVRVRMAADLVRVALATGAEGVARSVTETMEHMGRDAGAPLYGGMARRCRGLLQSDPDILLGAVAELRGSQRPLEVAFAGEDAAAALARHGRAAEGAALLEEALTAYEDVGAARDVARAEATLRALGVHRGRRGPRSRAKTGWGSLTRTERDVAALVVEGLTNSEIGARMFVSPRTVETHLSHVYRKLSISSRVELAAKVSRMGAIQGAATAL